MRLAAETSHELHGVHKPRHHPVGFIDEQAAARLANTTPARLRFWSGRGLIDTLVLDSGALLYREQDITRGVA